METFKQISSYKLWFDPFLYDRFLSISFKAINSLVSNLFLIPFIHFLFPDPFYSLRISQQDAPTRTPPDGQRRPPSRRWLQLCRQEPARRPPSPFMGAGGPHDRFPVLCVGRVSVPSSAAACPGSGCVGRCAEDTGCGGIIWGARHTRERRALHRSAPHRVADDSHNIEAVGCCDSAGRATGHTALHGGT